MYNVTVKIDGLDSRRRNASLLHLLIGFFLIAKTADYYRLTEYRQFLPIAPFLLVASFSLFYGFFRRRLDPSGSFNHRLRLAQVVSFAVIGLMLTRFGRPIDYIGVFVFSALSLLLMVSERRIFMETTIRFDEQGILIPGNYRDHLVAWTDLSNVVVREDYLTIFHKKQKYLQYQVLQDLSTLEVAKMNAFCKEQLESQTPVPAERTSVSTSDK